MAAEDASGPDRAAAALALDELAAWLESAWPGTPDGVAAVCGTAILRAAAAAGARTGRIVLADDPAFGWLLADDLDRAAGWGSPGAGGSRGTGGGRDTGTGAARALGGGYLALRPGQEFYRLRRLPPGPVTHALTRGEPVYVADIDQPSNDGPFGYLEEAGASACVALPLPGGASVAGVLELFFDDPTDVPALARRALEGVALRLGAVLDGLRR